MGSACVFGNIRSSLQYWHTLYLSISIKINHNINSIQIKLPRDCNISGSLFVLWHCSFWWDLLKSVWVSSTFSPFCQCPTLSWKVRGGFACVLSVGGRLPRVLRAGSRALQNRVTWMARRVSAPACHSPWLCPMDVLILCTSRCKSEVSFSLSNNVFYLSGKLGPQLSEAVKKRSQMKWKDRWKGFQTSFKSCLSFLWEIGSLDTLISLWSPKGLTSCLYYRVLVAVFNNL